MAHGARALEWAERAGCDVVHNHCLAAGPALARLTGLPCLSALHYVHPLLRCFPAHPYVAVSHAQRAALPELNMVALVHNGIDLSLFPVVEAKADYLLFMGRLDEKKGPDLAIEVARRLGARLILAGPPPAPDMLDYMETRIRPYLDGRIAYMGEARGRQKVELLAHARCLLAPVRWEEPFGLVAAEAMACGTPVVALRRGALPEVVPGGEAGWVVDTVDEMVSAVARVERIDPARCRRVVEDHFSAVRMADGYLAVYCSLLDERRARGHRLRMRRDARRGRRWCRPCSGGRRGATTGTGGGARTGRG